MALSDEDFDKAERFENLAQVRRAEATIFDAAAESVRHGWTTDEETADVPAGEPEEGTYPEGDHWDGWFESDPGVSRVAGMDKDVFYACCKNDVEPDLDDGDDNLDTWEDRDLRLRVLELAIDRCSDRDGPNNALVVANDYYEFVVNHVVK